MKPSFHHVANKSDPISGRVSRLKRASSSIVGQVASVIAEVSSVIMPPPQSSGRFPQPLRKFPQPFRKFPRSLRRFPQSLGSRRDDCGNLPGHRGGFRSHRGNLLHHPGNFLRHCGSFLSRRDGHLNDWDEHHNDCDGHFSHRSNHLKRQENRLNQWGNRLDNSESRRNRQNTSKTIIPRRFQRNAGLAAREVGRLSARPLSLVAADVSPLQWIRADARRRLRFRAAWHQCLRLALTPAVSPKRGGTVSRLSCQTNPSVCARIFSATATKSEADERRVRVFHPRRCVLPLLGGEGRGEGKHTAANFHLAIKNHFPFR